MVDIRNTILEATEDLQALLLGPMGYLQRQTLDHTYLTGLHAVYRFRIAEAVPMYSEASYSQVAKTCGLDEVQLRRIMRYAMTKHMFRETRPGFVAHTAVSRVLAEESGMKDWVGMVCEEMWPSAARTVDAMVKWPASEDPEHTGFSYANNTENAVFAELAQYPSRARRFANAMSMIINEEGYEASHILKAYDWSPAHPLLFVDIGGSQGDVSIALASEVRSIKCIVQDFPAVVAEGRAKLPKYLVENVSFMEHDFFTEQPVKEADIYFFRWIFHDWSDKYCVRLLQALIPALKEGARIIISDWIMPPPGVIGRYNEWLVRAFDIAMFEVFNSKEREADEWASLFKAADDRFQFIGIKRPDGSKLSFIEARWTTKTLKN
ncbi:MAG: hypothetical protein Q9219_007705 [cf. Caloplaca sp. 3 TL-2023]